MTGPASPDLSWRDAYRLRLSRRRLLWQAFRSRRALEVVADRSDQIGDDDILVFCVLRNETLRLPYFLDYYRARGVGHFFFIDNESDDGSAELVADAEDCTLYSARGEYRAAHFGRDWLNWLLARYGNRHWCLTVDTDELLVYPHCDRRALPELTRWLDDSGRDVFGALMIEPVPEGPLGAQAYQPGDDPSDILSWFDAGPFRATRQQPLGNLWVQGGLRERVFFGDRPERSPTLNKIPLIRWNWRHAYYNSTHSALPARLNFGYDGPGGDAPSGILLHSKFLPDVIDRAAEDLIRQQHFTEPQAFSTYYKAIIDRPILRAPASQRLGDWRKFCELGLMSTGGWT